MFGDDVDFVAGVNQDLLGEILIFDVVELNLMEFDDDVAV